MCCHHLEGVVVPISKAHLGELFDECMSDGGESQGRYLLEGILVWSVPLSPSMRQVTDKAGDPSMELHDRIPQAGLQGQNKGIFQCK